VEPPGGTLRRGLESGKGVHIWSPCGHCLGRQRYSCQPEARTATQKSGGSTAAGGERKRRRTFHFGSPVHESKTGANPARQGASKGRQKLGEGDREAVPLLVVPTQSCFGGTDFGAGAIRKKRGLTKRSKIFAGSALQSAACPHSSSSGAPLWSAAEKGRGRVGLFLEKEFFAGSFSMPDNGWKKRIKEGREDGYRKKGNPGGCGVSASAGEKTCPDSRSIFGQPL